MKTEIDRHLAPLWLLEKEGITQRQWRVAKRAELKAVLKAFSVFRIGCAYLPGYPESEALGLALGKLKHALSAKEWK